MTEIAWAEEYDRTISAFIGQQPLNATIEEQAIEHWQRNPVAFRVLVDEVSESLKAGKIKWGWTILVRRLDEHEASRDQTATVDDERGRRVRRAEQWLTNTGRLYDWAEAEAALFGSTVSTPELGFLLDLEASTFGKPGRPAYDGLLRAAIVETREHGPQQVHDSGGLLELYSEDQGLRRRIRDHWEAVAL